MYAYGKAMGDEYYGKGVNVALGPVGGPLGREYSASCVIFPFGAVRSAEKHFLKSTQSSKLTPIL